MSTLKVDSIANNGSAVDLTNGAFQIGGNDVVQGYTESASEPSSPTKGDIWWDSANEVLYQYLNGEFKELGTVEPVLDVAGFTYDNVSFSISSEDTSPYGITFNNDGTKMYITGLTNTNLFQYTLSTAFDISTASYDSVSFDLSGQDAVPTSVIFNNDGTKMYLCGYLNSIIYEYNLSTAFNISTASYSLANINVGARPNHVTFNNDGSKMYVTCVGSAFKQYSLSTPFSLSTASHDNVDFDGSAQSANNDASLFNSDGTKMFRLASNNIYQYLLSTGFDLSTITYDNSSFDVSNQEPSSTEIAFNADFTKIYVVGQNTDTVYQYSTGL